MDELPEWMVVEIATGLQEIRALSLEGTPATDVLVATAQVWCKALMARPTTWVESLDAHRLRKGFQLLLSQIHRWPAPEQLINLMPDRVAPLSLKLAAPTCDREQALANIREIRRLLDEIG